MSSNTESEFDSGTEQATVTPMQQVRRKLAKVQSDATQLKEHIITLVLTQELDSEGVEVVRKTVHEAVNECHEEHERVSLSTVVMGLWVVLLDITNFIEDGGQKPQTPMRSGAGNSPTPDEGTPSGTPSDSGTDESESDTLPGRAFQ